MKTKFITSIYSNLYGTKFGGRPSRNNHYKWSLLSLMKMTDADFVCYTSQEEIQNLYDFFHVQNNISSSQLTFKVFDLENHNFKELFLEYKDYENAKKSDRCIEIQYMKFIWAQEEIDNYDYYFWIDAGLSHCGLIPNKYLEKTGIHNSQYYSTPLFNNVFLKNLISHSGEKFTLVAKDNQRNYWSGTVNPKHYINYNNTLHVIGGLFGGKKELWEFVINKFNEYVYQVTTEDKILYHEENILSLMFRNHEEFFNPLYFDTWWHENENIAGLDIVSHCKENKSFYKILEELNEIYE